MALGLRSAFPGGELEESLGERIPTPRGWRKALPGAAPPEEMRKAPEGLEAVSICRLPLKWIALLTVEGDLLCLCRARVF